MKIYNGTQHEDTGDANESWLALRAGKFTGSDFHQYLSILDKGLSETAESNLYKKVLESLGEQFESVRSDVMERGNELEPFARREYMGDTFNDVQEVAFVDFEKLRAGCSPDGVIYIEKPNLDFQNMSYEEFKEIITTPIKKIIEIKCPEIKNYLKMAKGKIPPVYMTQMQFNMLITGAKSCDFVIYHPSMRLIIRKIDADADYQKKIVNALEKLNARYDEILEEIQELRR